MRKRLLAAVLLCALAVLAGCGKGNTEKTTPSGQGAGAGSVSGKEDISANEEVPAGDVSIGETVLLDQNDIRITAMGLNVNGEDGPELSLRMENHTDKNISLSTQYASVNGYMADGFVYEELSAGEQADAKMVFNASSLEDCRIREIADIEFYVVATDMDAIETLFQSDRLSVSTSIAEGYQQAVDDSGDVIYDKDGIRVVYREFLTDQADSYTAYALLYAENNSDRDISIGCQNTSVNGKNAEGYLTAGDIMAGKKSVMRLSFRLEDLKNEGIEQAEETGAEFYITGLNSPESSADTFTLQEKTD